MKFFSKENLPVGSRLDQTAHTSRHISYDRLKRRITERGKFTGHRTSVYQSWPLARSERLKTMPL